MARLVRAHDWAATPLGPTDTWFRSLWSAVELMLPSALPMMVAWGPGFIQLYNDAMRPLVGGKHPYAFGRGIPEVWPETWPVNGPAYARALSGEAVTMEDMALPVDRSEGPREAWFTGTFSPILDDTGAPAGVMVVVFETTARVLAERALRESGERGAFLLQLSDALRPLADPLEIQGAACRLLAERLSVDRAYYVEVDEAAGVALVERDFVRGSAPSLAGLHRIADFAWSVAILRRGECPVVPDTQTSDLVPPADRPACAAMQIIACMGAPLIKDGRLVGALCVTAPSPRDWTEAEVDLLREVGERIWAAIEQVRAEAALRRREEHLRLITDNAPVQIGYYDRDLRYAYINEEAARFFGVPREAMLGVRLRDFLKPQAFARLRPWFERALAGERVHFEDCEPDKFGPGRDGWTEETYVPCILPDGTVDGFYALVLDITERKRHDAALRDSEERYRAIVESIRDYAIFTTDPQGRIETWPPGAEAVFGWTAEEAIGQDGAITYVPADRETGVPGEELAEARERGTAPNVRWHARKDGGRVFIEGSTRPLRNGGPEPRGFLKVGQDVTERRLWEERQGVLLAELQHRTRNLMAVVRSMFDRTRRGSRTVEELNATFKDRLAALARVQGLLSRLDEGDRITFDELIRTELAAMGAVDAGGRGERVVLDGPEGVRLRSSTLQTFALALHELATNASKHGALAQPAGGLTVRWRLLLRASSPCLRIEWVESGVEMPEAGHATRGSGFGRELIERALPFQLGARTSLVLAPGGVRCTIELPVSGSTRVENEHA